jgi:hypothetical protein
MDLASKLLVPFAFSLQIPLCFPADFDAFPTQAWEVVLAATVFERENPELYANLRAEEFREMYSHGWNTVCQGSFFFVYLSQSLILNPARFLCNLSGKDPRGRFILCLIPHKMVCS